MSFKYVLVVFIFSVSFLIYFFFFFFFQAEDGIRDVAVTGVQTCALPISIFPNLETFLEGTPSQLSIQLNQGVMPWRSWLGAWFVQDSIKLRPNLTLSLDRKSVV